MVTLEVDREIEMFIRNQQLGKEVGGSRIGQRKKWNFDEAWQSLPQPGRELWSKHCPSECPKPR